MDKRWSTLYGSGIVTMVKWVAASGRALVGVAEGEAVLEITTGGDVGTGGTWGCLK